MARAEEIQMAQQEVDATHNDWLNADRAERKMAAEDLMRAAERRLHRLRYAAR